MPESSLQSELARERSVAHGSGIVGVTAIEKISFAAFESAGEGIVITDLAGNIQYANPVFEKITGYRREEVIGQNPRILKSGKHPDSFYQRLWQTLSRGEVWRGSFVNRRKDGTTYHSDQTIAPVRTSSGQPIGYVSIHEDVSARVRFDEQRRTRELQSVRDAADDRVRLARHELELARQVQKRLFPRTAPEVLGFDVAGSVIPAEETCGDYYDFIPMPDGRLGVVLGDVSGHGIGPALIMVETRACLRTLLHALGDIQEILQHINQLLVHDLESGRFVTLFLAILDPATRSLNYSAAGQPAYHFSSSGQVTRLDNSGMVLGLLADAGIPPGERIKLAPGELIFLATDGLHESHTSDGSMLGIERVLDLVRMNRHKSARAIIEELNASAFRFRQDAPQEDDITIVVIKATNEPQSIRPGSDDTNRG